VETHSREGSVVERLLPVERHVAVIDLQRHDGHGRVVESSSCLPAAAADKADVVVAATRDDNVNLMVAQVAKVEFGVARVLARVFEPRREAVCRKLGVETICPTVVASISINVFSQSAAKREQPSKS